MEAFEYPLMVRVWQCSGRQSTLVPFEWVGIRYFWISAAIEGDTQDLGIKDKTGILKNIESREKYLTDSEQEIVFHYTPKHASWMNRIEVWFNILVRKLLKWLSVKSVDELNAKILNFISYYNRTLAKAFKWSYQPKSRPSTSHS
ncbi:MAG: transposase [Verrucomicrobiales bacterium]